MAGLIVGGKPRDARLVRQLAEEHISKDNCIILLTIACESMPPFTDPVENPNIIDDSRF